MCMLTYFPPGQMPDVQALRNGTVYNDMGHGFAIVTSEGKIVRRTGMDAEKVIASFVRLRERFPERSAMFHSRLATAGAVSNFGCHPFQVGGDSATVVGHNGIFPASVQPGKNDRRSDTRIFAEDYLFGVNLDDKEERSRIEEWMGAGNKVVILTVNPHYAFEAAILNERMGEWHEGVWYSNGDYMDPGYRQRAKSWDDVCWTCWQTDELDLIAGVCRRCNVCIDCGYDVDAECQCYSSRSEGESSRISDEEWYEMEREQEHQEQERIQLAEEEFRQIMKRINVARSATGDRAWTVD